LTAAHGYRLQVTGDRLQGTGDRAQGTGDRAQGTTEHSLRVNTVREKFRGLGTKGCGGAYGLLWRYHRFL
jgi:hypothetical protein